MYRLLDFFYQYRAFMLFVLLETICLWLIVNNNNYQGAAFFNSSNQYVATVLETKRNIQDYFKLKQVNLQLSEENAKLRQLLVFEEQKQDIISLDKSDFLRINKYEFKAAKVINSSTAHFDNYITINKGKMDSIHEGMGIISSHGVVGRIKECSDHYCTVFSLLHKKFTVSGKIKNKGIDCNVRWDGKDPAEANLTDIPRHQVIAPGDTVITSGYNTYFPEGIMIGTIKDFKLAGGSFWEARIKLSTDFSSLSYVYIVKNKMEAEQDSLEQRNNPGDSYEK